MSLQLFALSIVSIWSATSAVRITHDISKPVDASISRGRRLISGSSSPECASMGGYSTNCIATNPKGCGCETLTVSEKQGILDMHNARRDMAAGGIEDCALDSADGAGGEKCPAATDMNYLFWDTGLEVLSTFWAHQCIGGHHATWNDTVVPAGVGGKAAGKYYLEWYGAQQSVLDQTSAEAMYLEQCEAGNCKARGYNLLSGSDYIGENLAYAGHRYSGGDFSFEDDVLGGVNQWYDESKDYVWSTGETRPGGGDVGHFTTGVWAKTRYLGCGYAICPGGASDPFDHDDTVEWLNVVCKYYPGGNYDLSRNHDPYTAAATSSTAGERRRRLDEDDSVPAGPCSECESDRQGCISSVTPYASAEPQNALCGGPQCSACAFDYNMRSTPCEYGFASCPSQVFTNDGTEGPAMHPTSRPVAFTGEPTLPPTNNHAIAMPEGDCSLHLSGFPRWQGIVDLNGEWPNAGDNNGRPYYSAPSSVFPIPGYEWNIYYSENCHQYVVSFFMGSDVSFAAVCRCEPKNEAEITACTEGHWDCVGHGLATASATATVVVSCDPIAKAVAVETPQISDNELEAIPSSKMAMVNCSSSGSKGGCECPDDVDECTLNAAGKDAAKNGVLLCGANAVCHINCVGESACGEDTLIYGQEGTVTEKMYVLCTGEGACSGWTVIDCGEAETCSLICTDEMSCKGITVNAKKAGSFECVGWCNNAHIELSDTDTETDTGVLALINIGTDTESVSLGHAALVAAVALFICAAMLLMCRSARKCRETRYAKVQLHEDSEPVTQSEAEEILHASD